MLLREIKRILGGDVSTKNSKMPGTSFGLSTADCDVGGVLRDVAGSVCEGCYAARIEAFRPSVKKGWTARSAAVHEATESWEGMRLWVQAMVERLAKLDKSHHRWHDSGDLQSDRHLSMIISVAQALPEIQFWLPTRERAILKRAHTALGENMPPNLTIRESAAMIGARLVTFNPTSMVVRDASEAPEDVWVCPAPHQGNACKDCRACWDSNVKTVAYIKH